MIERTELFTFEFPDKTDWKIIKELIESVDLDLKNNPIEGLKFSHRKFNKKLRQTCVVCTYSDPAVLLKVSNKFEDGHRRLGITRKFLKKETIKDGCCCHQVKELLKEWKCA